MSNTAFATKDCNEIALAKQGPLAQWRVAIASDGDFIAT
jgi:hypothetical protein